MPEATSKMISVTAETQPGVATAALSYGEFALTRD